MGIRRADFKKQPEHTRLKSYLKSVLSIKPLKPVLITPYNQQIKISSPLYMTGLSNGNHSKTSISRANELISTGNKYFRSKQYLEASKTYSQAIILEPSNIEANFNSAICDHYMGKDEQAISGLERLISGHTNINYSKTLYIKSILGKIIHDQPSTVETDIQNKIKARDILKDLETDLSSEDRISSFNVSLYNDAETALYEYFNNMIANIGLAAICNNKIEMTIPSYQESPRNNYRFYPENETQILINLDEKSEPQNIYFDLGKIFFDQHNYFKAISAFNKAAASYPAAAGHDMRSDAYFCLNIVYQQINCFDTAIDALKKISTTAKCYPDALIMWGELRIKLTKTDNELVERINAFLSSKNVNSLPAEKRGSLLKLLDQIS